MQNYVPALHSSKILVKLIQKEKVSKQRIAFRATWYMAVLPILNTPRFKEEVEGLILNQGHFKRDT